MGRCIWKSRWFGTGIFILLLYISMLCLVRQDGAFSLVRSRVPVVDRPCGVTERLRETFSEDYLDYPDAKKQVVEELLEYSVFNPELCEGVHPPDSPLVVIIVDTARPHFTSRQVIRETWGSLKIYREWRLRTLFLMGQSSQCEKQEGRNLDEVLNEDQQLWEEHSEHGDILVGNFADTYRNLTYKHLMGYKFVLERCSGASLIIKTDDDMFVNLPKILDFRARELENWRMKKIPKPADIYCQRWHDQPTRCQNCPNGKWFSTREEWPEDKYPPYCLGNDYMISREWLERIYSVRGKGGFFWVDDVFIMGKLRQIAQKEYNQVTINFGIGRNVTDKRWSPEYYTDNCKNDEVDFGFFSYLNRNWEDFLKVAQAMWKKAIREAQYRKDM